MAWRMDLRRVILAGRLRERKVQLLSLLEMESRRESQERLWAAESDKGRPKY
jgi:hypothetical protein